MSDEKTQARLEALVAGNLAFNIGLTKGEEGEPDVLKLGGNAQWNKLCFKSGCDWKPLADAARPAINAMILAALIAWIKSVLGITK